MKATLIFKDWMGAVEDLTQEERGELFTLILQHLNGVEAHPQSPAVRGAWGFVKKSINAGEELVEKRRTAGRMGGRPATETNQKQNKANESKTKQTKANESKLKQTKASESKRPNTTTTTTTNTTTTTTTTTNTESVGNAHAREGAVVDAPVTLMSSQQPTQEQVADYFKKIGGAEEQADRFFNHWESVGWVRTDGRRLVSWEAAARQWVLNDYRLQHQKETKNGREPQEIDYGKKDYTTSL